MHPFHLLGLQHGKHQLATQQFTDGRQKLHVVASVVMGLAVLNVDDAQHPIHANHRCREKGFISIFRQIGKGFEARVLECFTREREQPAFPRDPASESLAELQSDIPNFTHRTIVRRAEGELVPILYVKEAGIAPHEVDHLVDDSIQDIVHRHLFRDEPRNLLQGQQLFFRALMRQGSTLAFRHPSIISKESGILPRDFLARSEGG